MGASEVSVSCNASTASSPLIDGQGALAAQLATSSPPSQRQSSSDDRNGVVGGSGPIDVVVDRVGQDTSDEGADHVLHVAIWLSVPRTHHWPWLSLVPWVGLLR